MANKENLKPKKTLSPEEAKKLGAAGGRKSGESKRARKKLKEELELLLEMQAKGDKTYQEQIVMALVKKAQKGDTKAFEVIRDTIGEKPVEKQEVKNVDTDWFK